MSRPGLPVAVAEEGRPPAVPWRGRATRAEIDLDVLTGNVEAIRGTLPAITGLVAVVKANAYGHGAVEVARTAVEAGAAGLAVATVGEGVALRRAGLAVPILILGAIDLTEVGRALRHDLAVAVGTAELLEAVQAAARGPGQAGAAAVHVKIDTGMRRYGAVPEQAMALCRRVADDPRLDLAGVFTHFATADEDEGEDGFAAEQAALLATCLDRLEHGGIRPRAWHQANSAAAVRGMGGASSFARVGIALYGARPGPGVSLPNGVRPVMTLRSRVARAFELAQGDTVGYGRTYRADANERAALVPVGYADGYRRALSNDGWMGIGEGRAPVIGRVSMDQTVVRLPDGVGAAVGDEVVVMGGAGVGGGPSADDLAGFCGTIPYEIFTGIAARVPRLYLRSGQIVAMDDGVLAEEVTVSSTTESRWSS